MESKLKLTDELCQMHTEALNIFARHEYIDTQHTTLEC